MVASIGGFPFAIKRTILIGWTGGHFSGAFCLLKSVMPRRHLRGRPWMQIDTKTLAESPWGAYSERGPDLHFWWCHMASHTTALTLKVQHSWTLTLLCAIICASCPHHIVAMDYAGWWHVIIYYNMWCRQKYKPGLTWSNILVPTWLVCYHFLL